MHVAKRVFFENPPQSLRRLAHDFYGKLRNGLIPPAAGGGSKCARGVFQIFAYFEGREWLMQIV